MIVFSTTHLQRVLDTYLAYYNSFRTDLALDKDAPIHQPRRNTGPIQSLPIVGGLHHHYVRI